LGPQRSLLPEGRYEPRTAPHPAEGLAGSLTQLPVVLRAHVRQFVLFPVRPDVFDGIQFGSIGRQVLDVNVTLQAIEVIPHQTTAMCRQTIPDNQQRTIDLSDQRFQKIHHLRAFDRARMKPEVEAPERQAGNGGQRLPIEVVLQDGSLPARRPGSAAVGLLAYYALVDEDDRAALFS